MSVATTPQEIDLSEIGYGDRNLVEWETFLTVNLPKIPAGSHEVQKALVDLNNRYQVAYNCFNELNVILCKKEAEFHETRATAVNRKLTEFRAQGITKLPAKELLLEMTLSDADVKAKKDDMTFYDLIRTFFESNKIKLEKSMGLFTTLSYAVHSSDRMHYKS